MQRSAAQCSREGCDGAQAFFYQVQIRSADEPMTTFYKVGLTQLGCYKACSALLSLGN